MEGYKVGKRIIIGIVLAVLFLSALYLGKIAQAALFTIAAIVAVHEFKKAFAAKGYKTFMAPAYVFSLLFAIWQIFLPELPITFLWMACILAIILERIFNNKRETEETLFSMIPLVYPLPFFSAIGLMIARFGGAFGSTALLFTVACPLIGDTVAYFIGTFFGKHKLCPAISPKKTVEGAVASLFGSILAGFLLYGLQGLWNSFIPLGLFLLAGTLCGILGQVGDLFASVIKRWADIKDFGTILPGHGGVMDRLDSVLLCAPVVYACFFILVIGS